MKTRMRNVMLGGILVILLTLNIVHADLNDGLVGYWPFDVGSGSIAYDSSGNGNDGSIINGIWNQNGVRGSALEFHDNAYVTIGDIELFDFSAVDAIFTVTIWVNMFDAPDYYDQFVGKLGWNQGGWTLGQNSGGKFQIGIWPVGGPERVKVLTNDTFQTGIWLHVAAIVDVGADSFRIFVNGIEQSVSHVGQIETINSIAPNTEALRIAASRTYDNQANAILDEVRIYKRALSQSEIQQLAGTMIPATVDIKPDTLDLSSTDKWVTCYIIPADPYQASDILVSTVKLEDSTVYPGGIAAQHSDLQHGVLMVKFDRQTLITYIRDILEIVPPDPCVPITVTGQFTDGACFEGIDEIRVIDEKKKD